MARLVYLAATMLALALLAGNASAAKVTLSIKVYDDGSECDGEADNALCEDFAPFLADDLNYLSCGSCSDGEIKCTTSHSNCKSESSETCASWQAGGTNYAVKITCKDNATLITILGIVGGVMAFGCIVGIFRGIVEQCRKRCNRASYQSMPNA